MSRVFDVDSQCFSAAFPGLAPAKMVGKGSSAGGGAASVPCCFRLPLIFLLVLTLVCARTRAEADLAATCGRLQRLKAAKAAAAAAAEAELDEVCNNKRRFSLSVL